MVLVLSYSSHPKATRSANFVHLGSLHIQKQVIASSSRRQPRLPGRRSGQVTTAPSTTTSPGWKPGRCGEQGGVGGEEHIRSVSGTSWPNWSPVGTVAEAGVGGEGEGGGAFGAEAFGEEGGGRRGGCDGGGGGCRGGGGTD